MNEKTEDFKLDNAQNICTDEETIEALFLLELESIRIHSYVYEMNTHCFSNTEYMNWFSYSKKKLENNIENKVEQALEFINQNNSELIKNWLEENYNEVYKQTNVGLNEYIIALKSFFNKYSTENQCNVSLKTLIEFLETKRQDTYKNLIKTINEKKKEDYESKILNLDKIQEEIEVEKKKAAKLQDQADKEEEELNELESSLKKQKRTIDDLNERIKELEQEYKNID